VHSFKVFQIYASGTYNLRNDLILCSIATYHLELQTCIKEDTVFSITITVHHGNRFKDEGFICHEMTNASSHIIALFNVRATVVHSFISIFRLSLSIHHTI